MERVVERPSFPLWSTKLPGGLSLGALAACITACSASPAAPELALGSYPQVADYYVVDCLLPGQVRVVGGRTYLTPRRPARLPAGDCRVRGGEYVAYDRASLSSSLAVWLTDAELGDADAQYNVGKIFENGMGGPPDYESAAKWYGKAAEQGHPSALLSLGLLYEQGKGVEQDSLKALNLYRRSSGLPEDDILYQSAVNEQLKAIRSGLQEEIDARDAEIEKLQERIDALQRQLSGEAKGQEELRQLRSLVSQLQAAQHADKDQLARLREPSPMAEPDPSFNLAAGVEYRDKNFGRYYALIIGNEDYELMEDLRSPISDATRLADILETKYGFTVQLLRNANDVTVMQALYKLNSVITEGDNLLIYYAGHGSRRQTASFEAGYWLPVNAHRPPDPTFWIPTEEVSRYLGTSRAQRILLLADSCYAGILEDDPRGRLHIRDDRAFFLSVGFVDRGFDRKSRLLVSSGGDRPVLDDSGDGHSVFASALISVLEANDQLLTTPALFLDLQEMVKESAARQEFRQEPELKSISKAGHAMGDFYFVPSLGLAQLD